MTRPRVNPRHFETRSGALYHPAIREHQAERSRRLFSALVANAHDILAPGFTCEVVFGPSKELGITADPLRKTSYRILRRRRPASP
jgi:hypothetical protein